MIDVNKVDAHRVGGEVNGDAIAMPCGVCLHTTTIDAIYGNGGSRVYAENLYTVIINVDDTYHVFLDTIDIRGSRVVPSETKVGNGASQVGSTEAGCLYAQAVIDECSTRSLGQYDGH